MRSLSSIETPLYASNEQGLVVRDISPARTNFNRHNQVSILEACHQWKLLYLPQMNRVRSLETLARHETNFNDHNQ